VIVATLLGEKYVELALQCLGSMHRLSREPLTFRLHEDGTLTSASEARLRDRLPVHSVVRKEDADSAMRTALEAYPACRRFRDRFHYGIKLFDLPVLHPGEDVAFADCDVFFLRPYSGLFRFPNDSTSCLFMQDSQNAYSLRPWHMLGRRAIHLPRCLNGGLFYYRKAAFDLALLEDVIGRDYSVYAKSFWLEQTCFGAMAMAKPSAFWSATQIIVPTGPQALTGDLVAAHLTSSVRGLLSEAISRQIIHAAPVAIVTEAMRELSCGGFLVSEVRRSFRRRFAA
jgi:hypothetical protein